MRTVKEEFFQKARLTKLYDTIDELQTDLAEWLVYYNQQRPHQGYRNMGRTPAETIALMTKCVNKETQEHK